MDGAGRAHAGLDVTGVPPERLGAAGVPAPGVPAAGVPAAGGRVELGYFSLSGHAAGGDDGPYLAWHQLDHMPEQYRLPGLVLAQRWAATGACRAVRVAADDRWAAVEHVVAYLMGQPLDETLNGFLALGRQLAEAGRFPHHLPSCYRGGLRLAEAHAAPRVLVSPAAVPFRPHRGVYLVVEDAPSGEAWDAYRRRTHAETLPALLGLDGVAGAWVFATSGDVRRANFSTGDRRITVCYLDGEPVEVAGRLAPVLRAAWSAAPAPPLLAGPYESLLRWDWERFVPERPA